MTKPERSTIANQSTIAAFSILEYMAGRAEPVRVTDISNDLEMPRSRAYRYLQTLSAIDYVVQDEATERYRLTLKLFHIGQAIADATQLTATARPLMSALRDELKQTVTLSVAEENGMRVLDIVRVESPVQIITKPGAMLPFHSSAQGKVALAWGSPRYLENLKTDIAEKDNDFDWERLTEQIAAVRKVGWATAPEEILPGIDAISAPVFDMENKFAATITVVGSVQDITADPDEKYISAIMRVARRLSSDIGCLEYPL